MASEKHLALLRQGVSVWNEWRRSNPDTTPDLSGASLEGTYLENVNFAGANLAGADLSKCLLRWARFNGAILDDVALDGADVVNTLLGEKLKQQRLEKQRQETLEAHRQFLKSHNLEHQGVQVTTGKSPRVTYCWNCKGHLDNSVNFECSACAWILCRCGACGCGYSR